MVDNISSNPESYPGSQFDDPLYDPFVPEKVLGQTPDGRVGMLVVDTVNNYAEAMLPEIHSDSLREGDVLKIGFENETGTTLTVKEVDPVSLTFGSESLDSPILKCVDADNISTTVLGSCISATGTLRTPGSITIGKHLSVWADKEEKISAEPIADFAVLRLDESGEIREIGPNALHQKGEKSKNFQNVEASFNEIRNTIESNGYDLDEDDYERAGYQKFLKYDNGQLLFAERQGFGCRVRAQYEMYAYDSDSQVLRGLRSVPERDTMQFVTMQLTPEQLASSGFSGNDISKMRHLEPSNLHRASHEAPAIVTYTWRHSDDKNPAITVHTYGHGLHEKLMSWQATEQVIRDTPLEVNINQNGGEVTSRTVNPIYWVDPDSYAKVGNENTTVTLEDGTVSVTIGESRHAIPANPQAEIEAMVQLFKKVLPAKI